MDFSLGYIKSKERVLIRNFSSNLDQEGSKIVDMMDIEDFSLQGLFYDSENEESIPLLEPMKKFFPINEGKLLSLSYESFENAEKEEITSSFDQMWQQWLLQNNISLIEELFTVLHHLKELWPNDRTTFFEEFWFTLRSNLGASYLKIIYNDLSQEQQKNKNLLVQTRVEGQKLPETLPGREFESDLMEKYKNQFSTKLEIVEFDSQKGELVATAGLQRSPIIIMAKTYQLTRFQKSVISCLIDGLNT
ncbi:MAG: hypothetical protein VYD54_05070 [Bdellovibrionota bacterium]|nr:hypothetical protein [Bdellovibrionota bacterium]